MLCVKEPSSYRYNLGRHVIARASAAQTIAN
jgi:hypothetical protein